MKVCKSFCQFGQGYNFVVLKGIKSSPNDTILDCSKVEAFADNKLRLAKMMIIAFETINFEGKGENADYLACFNFITRFLKRPFFFSSFLRVVEIWNYVVKKYTTTLREKEKMLIT